MKAIEYVYAARAKGRSTGIDYINNIFTDFFELHGDRRFADDKAVIGGLARFGNTNVTVIALEKGQDTKSRVERNFGSAHPEGYRKAMRLMKQAEKFHRPVICYVDTAGAFCGLGAEERGMGQAISESIMEMMNLKIPTISILIGESGSGGALALAVANEVWMLEKAVYSVISPEGCASILYKDPKMAEEAAENLKLTANDMLKLGVVDKVIRESLPNGAFHIIRKELSSALRELCALSGDELAARRYNRFRVLG